MAAGTCCIAMETSIHSSGDAEEKADSCFSDDDDDEVYLVTDDDDDDEYIYQEFEELDFFQLPDTKSIVSDDSFYPPDNAVSPQRSPKPESPEPLTFFKACCSNNAIIVKIMIRQGVSEEEVREVDRNNRVSLDRSVIQTAYTAIMKDLEVFGMGYFAHPHSTFLILCLASSEQNLAFCSLCLNQSVDPTPKREHLYTCKFQFFSGTPPRLSRVFNPTSTSFTSIWHTWRPLWQSIIQLFIPSKFPFHS